MTAACLFPGALALSTPQENGAFFIKIIAILLIPLPRLAYRQTYIRMSDTSLPSCFLSAESLSLSLSRLQTTPANVTISYLRWENKLFFFSFFFSLSPHCTWGSADTITFAAELQMSLRLANQSHFFSLASAGSVMGFTPMTLGLRQMCAHE